MVSKKLIAGMVTGALLMAPLFTTAQASIASDQKRVQELRQQYNQRLKDIKALKAQEQSIEGQIAVINQQISELEQQISGLQADIAAGAAKIEQMKLEIKKTEEKLEARKTMLAQRLRVMYEDGNVSYLEVLFASTDFSDFIDRMSTLSLVVGQDKRLMEGIKAEKLKLDQIKAQLEQEQQLRLVQQEALKSARAEQDSLKSQQQELLKKVQKVRAVTEEEARKEANEIAVVEAQIAAAIAAQEQATKGKKIISAGSWTWPLPNSRNITSGYGQRWGTLHAGIDIAAPVGAPIVAVDNGIVLFAGVASGFGHWVVIKHANGLMSVYGHMYGNQIFVSVGQEVKRGQQIAAVGSDGQSTGPHLHFSVATGISGSRMLYIDPSPYLGL